MCWIGKIPITFIVLYALRGISAWITTTHTKSTTRNRPTLLLGKEHITTRRCKRTQDIRRSWTRSSSSTTTATKATLPNIHDNSDRLDLNLLLIDYYDSFTYNLVHILTNLCNKPPIVLAADCAESWSELLQQWENNYNNMTTIDGIIISPGPGSPITVPQLAADIIRNNPHLPILGVCLGHQILGHVYGATIQLAPLPIHGQVRPVQVLQKDALWENIPSQVEVTRYHSLCVTELPSELTITAVSADEDMLIMSFHHNTNPHFGVQFHPESIGTTCGQDLLKNFCQVVLNHKSVALSSSTTTTTESKKNTLPFNVKKEIATNSPTSNSNGNDREILICKLDKTLIEPEDVMKECLTKDAYSFWLDSSDTRTDPSISILGSSNDRIEYWGEEKPSHMQGIYHWHHTNNTVEHIPDLDILSYMEQQYQTRTDFVSMVSIDSNDNTVHLVKKSEAEVNLPFRFRGGHVGFLGYEVRHDTVRFLEEQDHGRHLTRRITQDSSSAIPTAAFLTADHSFVYDHSAKDWYLVVVSSSSSISREEGIDWMKDMIHRFQTWTRQPSSESDSRHVLISSTTKTSSFQPHRSHATYNHNFRQCLEHIRQGDSYELCLTNQLKANVPSSLDPFELYRKLRRNNPAPYGAYLHWNETFTICCSSPERFLSVIRDNNHQSRRSNDNEDQFHVETKPIKGTIARALPVITTEQQEADQARADVLRNSIKDRAENLMIVDLLRNDFSRVCNDVHVAKLMEIESFATVHQMVSTIRGTLQKDRNVIDLLRACFPGGSMTGAPKRRTMEILDELEEGQPRGPYSGCLGYLSWNGCMDMNIVIRTAIVEGSKVTIGSGGAITALSEPNDEYDELMLKASAVVNAVQEWVAKPLDSSTSSEFSTSPTLESSRQ